MNVYHNINCELGDNYKECGACNVDWPAHCNLCGKSKHCTTISEASEWAVNHGCSLTIKTNPTTAKPKT